MTNQNAIQTSNQSLSQLDASTIETLLIGGDLGKLTPPQRMQYYQSVCSSLGLNPLTKPFDYIQLNGKLTLYAKKDATDQLRNRNNVSIDEVDIKETSNSFMVIVKGHDNTGRSDVEIGVVLKSDMQGNAANAQMKAVTKAKRRLTLSLCGLGWLDETEVETIHDARPVSVAVTGEIIDQPEEMAYADPQPAPVAKIERPMKPEVVKDAIQKRAGKYNGEKINDHWRNQIAQNIEKEIAGYVADKVMVRRAITQFLVGKEHVDELTDAETWAIWKWLGVHKDGELWTINADTMQELEAIVDFLNPANS